MTEMIDITADVCPMTFVRVRLALDRLLDGSLLQVRLTGQEPVNNVPRTLIEQGHTVLSQINDTDGITTLLVRKASREG